MPSPMGARVDAAPGDNQGSSTYAASFILKGSKGILYGLSGYNSGPTQFVQLHDSATLPADTAIPAVVFTVPGSSNFSLSYGMRGRGFTNGIVICNSSTGPTKTIGASNLAVDAQTA